MRPNRVICFHCRTLNNNQTTRGARPSPLKYLNPTYHNLGCPSSAVVSCSPFLCRAFKRALASYLLPVMVSVSTATSPSSRFKLLKVSYPAEGICHCQLSRPPVNALNTDLWTELLALLTLLEKNHFPTATRVLIVSSAARGNIFSAGNDLTELHSPSTSKERFYTFWKISTLFLARLYKTPLYTIAAIRGATPAGGCVLSLCCDYRVALENTMMGLNEVAIGISVPKYYALLLLKQCTIRSEGERMISKGTMMNAQHAKRLGLVDDVVSGDSKQLVHAALRVASKFSDKREAPGRAGTKLEVRLQFAEDWENYASEEAQKAWVRLCEPDVVKSLGNVISRLSARKAKI